jgi:hypothetical protein
MPPDRDIEFIIELIPRTASIAQRPYHMNPQELEELKKQLAYMISKGLIHPSGSPSVGGQARRYHSIVCGLPPAE